MRDRPRRPVRTLLLAVVLTASAPALAQTLDAENGRVIAERWCASCHAVSPDQASAQDGVPSFREVAERGDLGGERLRTFLADPHPRMPDMSLTRDEIEDLAAYIDGLAD